MTSIRFWFFTSSHKTRLRPSEVEVQVSAYACACVRVHEYTYVYTYTYEDCIRTCRLDHFWLPLLDRSCHLYSPPAKGPNQL